MPVAAQISLSLSLVSPGFSLSLSLSLSRALSLSPDTSEGISVGREDAAGLCLTPHYACPHYGQHLQHQGKQRCNCRVRERERERKFTPTHHEIEFTPTHKPTSTQAHVYMRACAHDARAREREKKWGRSGQPATGVATSCMKFLTHVWPDIHRSFLAPDLSHLPCLGFRV